MNERNTPQNSGNKIVQNFTPEILEKILQNQTEELKIRGEEMNIQRENSRSNYEYSMKALDLQAEDLKGHREYRRSNETKGLILFITLFIVIATVIIIAMLWNKEAVALEIIKAAVLLIAGGSIGFGIGRINRTKSDTELN